MFAPLNIVKLFVQSFVFLKPIYFQYFLPENSATPDWNTVKEINKK